MIKQPTEENMGDYLCDLGVGIASISKIPKAQTIGEKYNYMKSKGLKNKLLGDT